MFTSSWFVKNKQKIVLYKQCHNLICYLQRVYEHVRFDVGKHFLNQVSFAINFFGIGHSTFIDIFFKNNIPFANVKNLEE